MVAPLQLLVFRSPQDEDVAPFEEAIARAFQGGKDAGGYLATGEDLGIQLRLFESAPPRPATQTVDELCHTLTVVLIDAEFLRRGDDALWDWLAACSVAVRNSNGRHGLLAIGMDERVGDAFIRKREELGRLQLMQVHSLGERAIRPTMLALRLVHECRLLLAASLPQKQDQKPGYLRLFISHAKLDGLPLAYSLKHQIETLGWLEDFYDADDLPAGCDWQQELERGVGSSLIVMLRTEAYDGRYWCQQEVLWADEYATPAVLVDARTSLNAPAGVLPFDRVPSVRIPDGNLLRILFLALREGLRFLLFARRVEQMKRDGEVTAQTELRVFSYPPSMAALLRASRSLSTSPSPSRLILYPDPPLRSGQYEAAQALVAAYAPGVKLLTPQSLTVTKEIS